MTISSTASSSNMGRPPVPARRGAILVVEDRDDVRQGLAQLLEFYGFLVEEIPDGETAVRALAGEHAEVALVLLDLMLPGNVSGRDVRTRMLGDADLADIPTIVVTASDVPAAARDRLSADAWLDKPFRFDDLLALVKRYVVPEGFEGG